IAYLRRAFDRMESDGLDKSHTEACGLALAGAWRDAGQWDRAANLLERILDARRRRLGNDHTGTVEVVHSLASTMLEAGDAARAVPLLEQILRAGARSPEVEPAEQFA